MRKQCAKGDIFTSSPCSEMQGLWEDASLPSERSVQGAVSSGHGQASFRVGILTTPKKMLKVFRVVPVI